MVFGSIHLRDKCIILRLGGIEPKGIHAALVGHPNQLSPTAMQEAPTANVVTQAQQMRLMVLLSHAVDGFAINTLRDFGWIFDGKKIRNERDCHPVVLCNVTVASDNDAHLAWFAATELYRCLGAYARKIDRVMAGRIQGPKKSVRFFHEQGSLGTAVCRGERQKCHDHESECGCA